MRLQVTGAAPVLGADSRFVRGDAAAYTVLRSVGLHRLFVYGRAQAQEGTTLAQDVLGLSRHDDVQVELPGQVPLTFGDAERVRGYRTYALGDRLLFGTAEYRVPLLSSLRTRILGKTVLPHIAASTDPRSAAAIVAQSSFEKAEITCFAILPMVRIRPTPRVSISLPQTLGRDGSLRSQGLSRCRVRVPRTQLPLQIAPRFDRLSGRGGDGRRSRLAGVAQLPRRQGCGNPDRHGRRAGGAGLRA